MRKILAVILTGLMAAFTMPGQTDARERVLAISADSPVEVRMKDNTRLQGRLGPVSDTGFELRTIRSGKFETQQIAFDQLRSIKDTGHKPHSAYRGLLIAGIAVGAVVVIIVIVGAATGFSGH